MTGDSPFHDGERAVQARLGVRDRIDRMGRKVIRDHLPEQHRAFFAELRTLFVGSVDGAGWPWASMLVGEPGFARSPEPRWLDIAAAPLPGDRLAETLREGARLGLLGLQFETRRRNRLNGTIRRLGHGLIGVSVDQSFGNCPRYINRRRLQPCARAAPAAANIADRLDAEARLMIGAADVLFIASCHRPEAPGSRYGADVSHRGGSPGFVRVEADGSLAIPDYAGNNLFNTLGNIAANGRAGLLFLDFVSGDALELSGHAAIDWDAPEAGTVPGVERLLRVRPVSVRLLRAALPLTAELLDTAPTLQGIGTIAAGPARVPVATAPRRPILPDAG